MTARYSSEKSSQNSTNAAHSGSDSKRNPELGVACMDSMLQIAPEHSPKLKSSLNIQLVNNSNLYIKYRTRPMIYVINLIKLKLEFKRYKWIILSLSKCHRKVLDLKVLIASGLELSTSKFTNMCADGCAITTLTRAIIHTLTL